MQKSEEIVKIKHGRQCTIRLDVKQWRKKMRRYKRVKAEILEWLHAANWDNERLATWINTPVAELANRPPKALFTPDSIQVLRTWVRRYLKSTSTL